MMMHQQNLIANVDKRRTTNPNIDPFIIYLRQQTKWHDCDVTPPHPYSLVRAKNAGTRIFVIILIRTRKNEHSKIDCKKKIIFFFSLINNNILLLLKKWHITVIVHQKAIKH